MPLSLEFVNFPKGKYSPLATDLIALFQTGIDIVNSQPDDYNKIDKTLSWWDRDGVPKLQAILKNRTGIPYNRIFNSKCWDFSYATTTHVGDTGALNMMLILDRICGTGDFAYAGDEIARWALENNIHITSIDELKKVSDSYDQVLGKFKNIKLTKDLSVSADLWFDPYSAFLTPQTGNKSVEALTAAEVASIICHEVGHSVSTLLLGPQLWYVAETKNAILKNFSKNASLKDQVGFLVSTCKTSGFPLLQKVGDKLNEIATDESKRTTSGEVITFSICRALWYLVMSPFYLFPRIMSTVFPSYILGSDDLKLGDTYKTAKNVKYCEQLADEYCARQGFGYENISALHKAERCGWNTGRLVAESKTAAVALSTMLVISAIVRGDLAAQDEHEVQNERCLSFARYILKSLQRADIPNDLKAFWLKQYEDVIALYKKPTGASNRLRDSIFAVTRFLSYIVGTPTAMLYTGRFNEEMDKLFKQIQDLSSNKLNYNATKLELMK